MEQQALFFESVEEALSHVVSALGGAKAVGAKLRQDMGPEAAGRWLKDCLNGDRRETLHPGQLLWLLRSAREAGVHTGMDWLCQAAGYARPAPMEPADEQAALMREFIRAADIQRSTLARLEQLTASGVSLTTDLRVVK